MGNRGLALPRRRQPSQFSDGLPVPDRSARSLAGRSPAGSRLRERHGLIALHSSDPVDLRVRRRRLCKLPHRLCRARERNLRGRLHGPRGGAHAQRFRPAIPSRNRQPALSLGNLPPRRQRPVPGRRHVERLWRMGDTGHGHASAYIGRHGGHQPHLHRTVRLRSLHLHRQRSPRPGGGAWLGRGHRTDPVRRHPHG